ncbi:MAG: acyl-CoA dehydrogenase [Bacillota bacterium]|jgi:alkylation response protein AidB-like acyl-CoA dehydrogenase
MLFRPSEEHEAIRRRIRELAEKEFRPKAAHYDETGEFPAANMKLLAEAGFVGINLPDEYGGAGLDMLSHTICVEEIARCCATTAVIFEVHNTLHSETIAHFGTEEQKRRYLPALASGEKLGAFCLTEPGAGSDAGALKSTAVLDGDHYVLSGQKCFITNGGVADLYLVMALTDKEKGSRGITCFIVEKGTEGLSFGKPEDKMGIRASHTTDVFLENVRVPVSNRLGAEGDGFKIAMSALDAGRLGIGAQALGIAQAAYEASVAYAKERVQFGKPIAELQAIQWMIADMATDIEAARLLLYRAAELYSQPGRHSAQIAMAKLKCAETAMTHTIKAVQIHGGYGYMREYGIERLMRDAKITEIYEGTSEIMRLIIALAALR